jgi:outer membrane protein assembly factor BamD
MTPPRLARESTPLSRVPTSDGIAGLPVDASLMLHLSVQPRGSRAVVHSVAGLVTFLMVMVEACHQPIDIKKFQGSPDRLYAASVQAFRRHRWDDAVAGFEKVTLDLPAHDTLLARAYYYLGQAHQKKGEPLLAAQAYSRLADAFPDDSLAAPALFAAGKAYERLWRRPDLDATYGQSALSDYQTLLALYPTSPLKDPADQRVAHLQEWFAEKDYKNGLHYYHRKAYDSAIIYFKDVIKNYPNVPVSRDAYLRLVDSYRAIRYKDDAADVCNTLRITYPKDQAVMQRCGEAPTSTAQHP